MLSCNSVISHSCDSMFVYALPLFTSLSAKWHYFVTRCNSCVYNIQFLISSQLPLHTQAFDGHFDSVGTGCDIFHLRVASWPKKISFMSLCVLCCNYNICLFFSVGGLQTLHANPEVISLCVDCGGVCRT